MTFTLAVVVGAHPPRRTTARVSRKISGPLFQIPRPTGLPVPERPHPQQTKTVPPEPHHPMRTAHALLLCRYMCGEDLPGKESSIARTLLESHQPSSLTDFSTRCGTGPQDGSSATPKATIRKHGFRRRFSPSLLHSDGNSASSHREPDSRSRTTGENPDSEGGKTPEPEGLYCGEHAASAPSGKFQASHQGKKGGIAQ